MNKEMKLSLVICVADDLRIKSALDSIDENCEVVVVLNGATADVKNIVLSYRNNDNFKLKILELPERNLSKSRNYGMENASYDKVVFYDSDTIIVKGALKSFYNQLEKYLLVDGKVCFKKDNFRSKIIAYTRELGIPGYALCPAIGVHKDIKKLVGNYYFDNDIKWIEDSELNIRAKKANIKIGIIKEITCIHDNLTFKQDLKSAYRYGSGVRIAAKKGLHKKRPTANWGIIPNLFQKNFFSGTYYIFWNIVYCVGYFTQK